jgi:translation initiation factor 2 beta subunit (eIF-2beta)/eIF-5
MLSWKVLLLCSMHRQPEHVMAFLLAELGTSGSLDGQQRLVVKGRFAPKVFEGILRRYVSKFLHFCFLRGLLLRKYL